MMRSSYDYRQAARQAYHDYVAPGNPDHAQRTTFIWPIPTQVTPVLLPTIGVGKGVLAMDVNTFLAQYDSRITAPVLDLVQQRWLHRQVYAYSDAYASRIVVVYIPAGACVSEPIHLDNLYALDTGDHYESCIIVLGDDAKATIIDTDRVTSGTSVNARLYYVGVRAQLTVLWNHTTHGQTRRATAHTYRGGQDSTITVEGIMTSTTQTDIWIDMFLPETGAQATMRGVYVINDQARMHLITQQQHSARHTTSELALQGCLIDNAYAAYHGHIHISEAAQHTTARQRNNTLLMCDSARAISIPTLEALAHEVHCVHASAIGSVDKQALAYLIARGIAEAEARMLLVEGFLQSALGSKFLEPALHERLRLLKGRS